MNMCIIDVHMMASLSDNFVAHLSCAYDVVILCRGYYYDWFLRRSYRLGYQARTSTLFRLLVLVVTQTPALTYCGYQGQINILVVEHKTRT